MQISGPLPVNTVGQTSPTLEFKPFQRVTAEILQVNGTQAVISIDGIPVVADVPSADVAASLKGRATAQFIVGQTEDGKTTLRLVTPGQAQVQAPLVQPGLAAEASPNLPLQLLKEFGLPVNNATQTAAQAAINQRLAIQPGQMDQLLRTLASQPGWGSQEANLAAAILAAGLPLTPESLELAARPAGLGAENLAALLGQLQAATQDAGLTPELRELAGKVLLTLQDAVLVPNASAALPEKLARAVDLTGRPVENLLAETVRGQAAVIVAASPEPPPAPPALLPGRGGVPEIARQLDQLRVVVQGANLPVEFKNLLRAINLALQGAASGEISPADLGAELARAVKLFQLPPENGPVASHLSSPGPSGGALPPPQAGQAGSSATQTTRQLGQLQTTIQQSELPPVFKELLRAVIQVLQDSTKDYTALMDLGENLGQTVQRLGQPVANVLAEQARPMGAGASAASGAELSMAIQSPPEKGSTSAALVSQQLGQLQAALRDASLPIEARRILRTVYQTLQEAVLTRGVTPDLADLAGQLVEALDGGTGQPLGNWLAERARLSAGVEWARQAAQAGISPGAANVADPKQLQALVQMQTELQQSGLPPPIQEVLNRVYQVLLQNLSEPGGMADLAGKLATALGLAERGQENRQAQEAQQANSANSSAGLISLAHLQQEAGRAGKHELVRVLDDFMQSLSQAQWQNIPSASSSQRQDWVEAALWMRLPVPEQGQENVPVRLRIDRDAEGDQRRIDPVNAHIIVQVELPGQQVFEVEIDLNQRQVQAGVTVPDGSFYEAAQDELASLAESLQDQGYSLKDPQVEVGAASQFQKITVLPAQDPGQTGVDREA